MPESVTLLLQQWRGGDQEAFNQLLPLVYSQLRSLAGAMMRSERPGHTLRATALVHEAYLKLAGPHAPIADRAHFFALSATIMRHILLDWAKARCRSKRGNGGIHETLKDDWAVIETEPETIIEVDRLLNRLNEFDQRKVKVVEMIFFGGMTYDEASEALGVSPVTIHRELRMAKAWMRSELSPAITNVPVQ